MFAHYILVFILFIILYKILWRVYGEKLTNYFIGNQTERAKTIMEEKLEKLQRMKKKVEGTKDEILITEQIKELEKELKIYMDKLDDLE